MMEWSDCRRLEWEANLCGSTPLTYADPDQLSVWALMCDKQLQRFLRQRRNNWPNWPLLVWNSNITLVHSCDNTCSPENQMHDHLYGQKTIFAMLIFRTREWWACDLWHWSTKLKSLGYNCNNSQQYIVWVEIINLNFMPKIIRY